MTPLLSIIVISHEQREELRRCLDSIMAMQLPFAHEIIVSDDRSMDGTREMLEGLMNEGVKELMNEWGRLVVTYCNSDEGNCANNSQRSGYNRCNAYRLAKGKYIAHVDADDYFRAGAEVYIKQVEALETHPECALAMSNCLVMNGKEEDAEPWSLPRKMIDGEVFDVEELLSKAYFRINQCFMERRNPNVDPVALYGNRYVDSVITYHHLQFGKIVFVDACDYIYVRSEGSVTISLSHQSKDNVIMWCLGLYIPLLIPSLTGYFFTGIYYQQIREVIKMAKAGYKLQPSNYNAMQGLHAYIYDCFNRDITNMDKIRLSFADVWIRVIKKIGMHNRLSVSILRELLYKE